MSEQPPEDETTGTDEVPVGPPTITVVTDYLTAPGTTVPEHDQIVQAYRAEKAAQRSVCRVPPDDALWPGDLYEALCRRVAANLAVRANPLGIKAGGGEFGTAVFRVGGRDAEVRRLEAPWRKRRIG
ncbi:hypothetical protein [Nocardioides alcanivorans]|uniref:hypothetical protein n=1 Tax=Nocardioides alcanivorans TaxID=2897352 RepID=UPI001F249FDD|nr:hypothetical protein [Nocardioides alcanivorans]